MSEVKSRIPVVDLQTVGLGHSCEPDKAVWRCVGSQLCKALEDIGFVYITSHGLPQDVIEQCFAVSGEFFPLPGEQKMTVSRRDNQGYVAVDRERLAAESGWHELRESFDIKNQRGIFPDQLVPAFRPTVGTLMEHLLELARRLLKALEFGLNLEPGCLLKCHDDIFGPTNGTCIRILNYPPVPADAPPNTVRCGAHTDYGTITILMQDDMGGLEVRDRSQQWVAATPLPGALLINVGDLLQMWTNGTLIATEHRVLVPEAEHKQRRARRSIAFFVHPNNEVLITPLDGSPPQHPPVTAKQHLLKRFAETYRS